MSSIEINCSGSSTGPSVTQCWRNLKQLFLRYFAGLSPNNSPTSKLPAWEITRHQRVFHPRCEALIPCIKIEEGQLAQWFSSTSWRTTTVRKRPWRCGCPTTPGKIFWPWSRNCGPAPEAAAATRPLFWDRQRGGRGPRGQGGRDRADYCWRTDIVALHYVALKLLL